MRAVFAVETLVSNAQALYGASADEMLFDDGCRVFGAHIAVPDGFGIDHDHGAVLALVEAAGLVDAHAATETGGLGELLQLGMKIAFSIGGTGGAGSTLGAHIMADKNMTFECGQAGKTSCLKSKAPTYG